MKPEIDKIDLSLIVASGKDEVARNMRRQTSELGAHIKAIVSGGNVGGGLDRLRAFSERLGIENLHAQHRVDAFARGMEIRLAPGARRNTEYFGDITDMGVRVALESVVQMKLTGALRTSAGVPRAGVAELSDEVRRDAGLKPHRHAEVTVYTVAEKVLKGDLLPFK